MKTIKKFLSALAILFSFFNLNSQSKFDTLIQKSTLTELKQEFSKTKDLYKVRVNNDLDTILMSAIKHKRGFDIVNLILKEGCKVSWQNRYNQDGLTYALKYSTDEKILKLILKKSGNKKALTQKLLYKDKTQKFVWEYAEENQTAFNLIKKYLPSNLERSEKPEETENSEETMILEDSKKNNIIIEENSPKENIEQPVEIPEVSDNSENLRKEEILQKEEVVSENSKDESQIQEEISKTTVEENKSELKEEISKITESTATEEDKTDSENVENSIKNDKDEQKRLLKEKSKKNLKNDKEKAEQIQKQNKKEENNKIKEQIKTSAEKKVPISSIEKYKPVYLYDYANNETLEIKKEESKDFTTIDNPDKADENGVTNLMKASKSGNLWLVKSLVKSGADINLRDKEGWTALMYALRYQNNLEVVNFLTENGAILNDKNNLGISTLAITSMWTENPEILKKVLKAYSPGNNEIFKSFILTITSENTNLLAQSEKINIFINKNIPINRIYKGKTPLMYAAIYGKSTEIIDILLQNGAITTIRTIDNKTAFDYATENSNLPQNEIYWALNTGR